MDTVPPPVLTLFAVMNTMLGAVGNWIVAAMLRRDIGQVLMQRIADVQEMWTRFEAGTLRRYGPRAPRVKSEDEAAEKPARAKPVRARPVRLLPRKFGWLLTHLGYHAGYHTQRLENLLAEPGFQEFLRAYPNVALRLRPVCRAFGVNSDRLGLPRKARVPRPRKPRRKPYTDIPYRKWAPGETNILRVYRHGRRWRYLERPPVE